MKKFAYTQLVTTTSESIRHNRFMIFSAVINVLIVVILWQMATRPPINHTTSQSAVTTQIPNGPLQSNPLFATRPTWTQDFTAPDYTILDNTYWTALEGPVKYSSNKEQQYYTSAEANLRIENGALQLTARNDSSHSGYKYTSARIDTLNKQSFQYGRIDIVAKLPQGSGTWPAVWMLPTDDIYANKTPLSDPHRYRNGGEIDIIEAIGSEPNIVYGVAHAKADLSRNSDGLGSYKAATVASSSTSYHKYSLLWTPANMTFTVDDQPFFTYTKEADADYTTWPFDQPFYLIVNLAMGGTWAGANTRDFPGDGIDKKALPASFAIQSINYYPYKGK